MEDKNIYQELGEQFKKLRKAAKKTQEEIAHEVGMYRSEISAFESRGEQIRSVEKINALFNALDYEISSIQKKLLSQHIVVGHKYPRCLS